MSYFLDLMRRRLKDGALYSQALDNWRAQSTSAKSETSENGAEDPADA